MPAVIPFIPAIAGVAGGIGGLIGQKKQQGRTNAWENAAMGGLQGYGQAGLQDFQAASGGYQNILANPEQWTGGTAAQLGQQTQSQLGSLSRMVGRSGMAGASARDLFTENLKNNMQARIMAKLGALQGLGELGRTGAGAYSGMLSGAEGIARTNLMQNAQSQNIFGSLGGSLYDIFSGIKIGGKLPTTGRGGSPGDFGINTTVPFG